MKNISQQAATGYGIIAILLWSTIVGLLRSVSESFGPVGGAALVYTLGAIILLLTMGWPKLTLFPKKIFILGNIIICQL